MQKGEAYSPSVLRKLDNQQRLAILTAVASKKLTMDEALALVAEFVKVRLSPI